MILLKLINQVGQKEQTRSKTTFGDYAIFLCLDSQCSFEIVRKVVYIKSTFNLKHIGVI